MEFSIELLNAVASKQKQREAEEAEKLRQAIATSIVPLPEDLAAVVVSQFITEMRDTMRCHPGYQLAERRDSYRTSLSILQHCLADVPAAIDRFEAFALSEEWLAPNHRLVAKNLADEFANFVRSP